MAFTAADTSLRDKEYLKFVGAATGSQMYVAVSIQSGLAITIGSVSATVDSVYIQSGANIDLGSAWTNIGSVLVSNNVGISGIVNQGTSPWTISGTATIAGSVYSTGSINIATDLSTIGSYAGVGSIIGSVYQLTNPWVTSGTSTVAGSIYATGSINIAGFTGSIVVYPGQTPWATKSVSNTTVGSSFILSGTAALLFSPSAGSKYVITDIIMSTDSAMYVRLFESGATQDFVRAYFAANGGLSSNFQTAIKGTSAGSQVYLGQSANGSLFVTLTGYSEA